MASKRVKKCRCLSSNCSHQSRARIKQMKQMKRQLINKTRNIKNDVDIEKAMLQIYCARENFDEEFFNILYNQYNIHGLKELQLKNRRFIESLRSNLKFGQDFNKPTFLQFLSSLDRVDIESPVSMSATSAQYLPHASHNAKQKKQERMIRKKKMEEQRKKVMQNRRRMSYLSKQKIEQYGIDPSKLRKSCSKTKNIKSKIKQKRNNIGFKVGAADDIINFRDRITHFRMPMINDITCEGIFNDYYFDTQSNENGTDLKENDMENEGDIINNKKQSKHLFYPSYCYAKSRIPYALLMAKSIAPNISENDMISDQKDYEIGQEGLIESSMIEQELDDIEFNIDDTLVKEREIFMTIGLNSNISASDFDRKKLNIVILLDISGSMNKPFENVSSRNMSKMQVACKSLIALLTHLRFDDRIGLILFNKSIQHRFYLTEFCTLSFAVIRNILHVSANGGTDFEKGYNACIDQFRQLFNELKHVNSNDNINKEGSEKKNDMNDEKEHKSEYDNRIIVLTDMCPTLGKTGSKPLMKMVKKYAEKKGEKIYTTFIGIGLDFNADLVSKISKVRGCNYSVCHNNAEFIKKLDEEFDFMVSPLVFNLKMTLKSEGNMAYIDGVYGSDDINDVKKGQVMNIKTLFPSPVNDEGDTKGGIVLIKIKKKNKTDSFNMRVECEFEDKYGKKYKNKQMVEFGEDNKYNADNYYDNKGVQKGILLTRYVLLMQSWLKHDRYLFYQQNVNRKNVKIKISNKYKKIFQTFVTYFEQEMEKIGDKALQQEIDLLTKLCSDSYLKAAADYKMPKRD